MYTDIKTHNYLVTGIKIIPWPEMVRDPYKSIIDMIQVRRGAILLPYLMPKMRKLSRGINRRSRQ